MGQILILEGEDFSNNPNAINVTDLPLVTDALAAFYTGYGSTLGSEDAILAMPSLFSPGSPMNRIGGQTRSPIYFAGSGFFKGKVIRFSDSAATAIPGLIGSAYFDLSAGVSFTWMIRNPVSTTSTNRVLLGIQPLGIQFRVNSNSGLGHLQVGSTNYDVGLHGVAAGVYALTLVITQTEAKLYKDGALISTVDISGSALPDSAEGSFSLGSNWLGNVGLLDHQVKQFYFHAKELSLMEVGVIHDGLANLLV